VPPPRDDAFLASQLGLDVDTYRLLRQLEEREILPEDYDLLGRLDESVQAATLSSEKVSSFSTEVYHAEVVASHEVASMSFGFDFWRLPLPQGDEEVDDFDAHCFGLDFWKIPLPALPECTDAPRETAMPSGSSGDTCGVCLVDF